MKPWEGSRQRILKLGWGSIGQSRDLVPMGVAQTVDFPSTPPPSTPPGRG